MTRKECLDAAAACVLKDRNREYGGPEDSFGVIANFWSVYLGRKVYPHDVAMMMALLKIARIKGNKSYRDGYIDLAGYAACGAECAGGKPAPKAEGGCCQNENDRPEFKPGDKVQVQRTCHREWENAVYVMSHPSGFGHIVHHPDDGRIAIDVERVRPAPKAEGVEELVDPFRDAPQTPEAVCRHIVDANPSVYPRTPTGEELAELAEEEGNAGS